MPEQKTEVKPDFSGWATKNDLVCSDGRVIKQDAFAHNDKQKRPLVWQHGSKEPGNILGYVILHNMPEGVYADAYFNDTPNGQNMKTAVLHGDIDSLSIWANELVQKGQQVLHGDIKEVSLCLAGANPGAKIENLYIEHSFGSEEDDSEAIITTGLALEHILGLADEPVIIHADDKPEMDEETIGDIVQSMNPKQQDVLQYLVGQALQHDDAGSDTDTDASTDTSTDASTDESVDTSTDTSTEDESDDDNSEEKPEGAPASEETDAAEDDELEQSDTTGDHLAHNQEGSTEMTRNAFEQGAGATDVQHKKLTLDQIETIVRDAQKPGSSMKESFFAHAEEYGITNIDFLFPDFKTLSSTPELLARKADWVQKVLGGVKKSPFSRIKSIVADLTAEEARAKGYVTGNEEG